MTMPARDFRGYGPNPPNPRWPRDARIGININLNFEAGGERSVLKGAGTSENILADETADRIVFVDEGLAIGQGTPAEAPRNPKQERTQRFLRMVEREADPII